MEVVIGGVAYAISAEAVELFMMGVYSIGFLLLCGWAAIVGSDADCGNNSQYEDTAKCQAYLKQN